MDCQELEGVLLLTSPETQNQLQTYKLKSLQVAKWGKDEWRMMKDDWRMMKVERWMMKDDDFKLLKGIALRLMDEQTNGWMDKQTLAIVELICD